MMKKVLLIVFAVAATASMAQKKPKITQAEAMWKSGEFVAAKEIVDAAAVHEKTKDKSKTWFIRGLVYASLDTAGNPAGDVKVAREAFVKALELTSGSSEDFTTGPQGMVTTSLVIPNLWAHYLNLGVQDYETNPNKAIGNFEKSVIILPDSLIGYYYAGRAAQFAEDNDKALAYFKKYIDEGGDEVDAFVKAMYILSTVKEDHEGVVALANQGLEIFPGNQILSDFKFRALYSLGKIDEAIAEVEQLIADDPNNPEFHFVLGVIKDNIEKFDESEGHYKNALAIDPNHFNSNFNIGVIYRNNIAELIKQKTGLGMSKEDQKKYDEIDNKIKDVAEIALPFWEKCYELRDDDVTSIETLEYIYTILGKTEKANQMDERMKELGVR